MLRYRLRAAWRAFKDPSLLEAPEPIVVVHPVVAPVVDERAAPEPVGEPLPEVRINTHYGKHRVVRHHAGTDTLLYPLEKGQDSGAEARRVCERYKPRYKGEYAVYWYVENGQDVERWRKEN